MYPERWLSRGTLHVNEGICISLAACFPHDGEEEEEEGEGEEEEDK